MTSIPVITLDGPSGAGKGTLGLRLAAHLDWHYLDSGALYRIVAHHADEAAIEAGDWDVVVDRIDTLAIDFVLPEASQGKYRVVVSGRDVTAVIRTVYCGQLASKVSSQPKVRARLLQLQRDFRKAPGLVTDGRDMGTVVFPDAQHKFFINASSEARAKRRFKQLQEAGEEVVLEKIVEQIEERDARDRHRAISPCVPAKDAIMVDTTNMNPDDVLAFVLERIGGAWGNGQGEYLE